MGMSATQARYLNLIAQQSDLEFQGQQINESRTTLSEQTNNLYTQLQNMSVPTPPMTAAYTNIQYTASDNGVITYTLGAIRPSNSVKGKYTIDMSTTQQGHNLSKDISDSVWVTTSASYLKLAPVNMNDLPFIDTGKYTASEGTSSKPDHWLLKNPNNKTNGCYTGKELKEQDMNPAGYVEVTLDEENKVTEANSIDEFEDNKLYMPIVDSLDNLGFEVGRDDVVGLTAEKSTTVRGIPTSELNNYYVQGENGKAVRLDTDASIKKYFNIENGYAVLKDSTVQLFQNPPEGYKGDLTEIKNPDEGKLQIGNRQALQWNEVFEIYPELVRTKDDYTDAIAHSIETLFPDKKNLGPEDFYYTVTMKGSNPELTFYLKDDVERVKDANTGINGYKYANAPFSEEKSYDPCDIEFDASGRITKIYIPNDESGTSFRELKVEAKTVTDEKAYADAMAEYEHDKYLYDQNQTAINAQMSIIQAEDKKLELKLTRLDNERTQITTEIEALKKVIGDNIESSYKTFSG